MPDTPSAPDDPMSPVVEQHWPPNPLLSVTLAEDLSVLAWLENSRSQLSSDCTNHLCGALLEWSMLDELWPDPLEPAAGPDCDHLEALIQVRERLLRRIVEASTVQARFDLARIGRELSNAIRGQRYPKGLAECRQRELVSRMPWLAGPPAPVGCAGGWL